MTSIFRPQPGSSNTEVLGGLVERVTYHNLENGFCPTDDTFLPT
jgi:hypothetical protein